MNRTSENAEIRSTVKNDIPAIMQIIKEAQADLKALGISQWQNGYPNEEAFLMDIEKGISYVLEKEGQVVATAAISFEADPNYADIYEGEWLTAEAYGVIHRIAVKKEYKREGCAAELIKFAEREAERKSVVSIRIDTHEGNLPMRSFLKKQEFTECGAIYLNNRKTIDDRRIAYEKRHL